MKLMINFIKKIYSYFDFKLGRFFFKNDNNFLLNIIGHLQLKKKIFNFTDNQYSIDLFNNGFTKIEPFSKEELKHFSKELEDLSLSNPNNFRVNLDISDHNIKKVNNLLKTNKSLISSLNAYFKSNFIIAEINIYRNKYFNKSENIELINENFHCDHYKKIMLKLFINLSEVKKQNGPLEIFTKHNTKKIIQNGYYDRNNYGNAKKILEDQNLKFINTGNIGESLLCATTECLHRASIPLLNHHRDIMAVTLFKDFSKNFNPIKYEEEINKTLAKRLGKLNFT